jgi:hypothetical protein
MMDGFMTGMMASMGLLALLVIVVLILLAAALLKYLFAERKGDRQ